MLVHGWESNAARWKRLFDLLENEDRYRVVAIDAPAHGGSGGSQFNSPLYAQFIKKACDHYHPDILIGHSIGAASIVFYLTHLQAQPAEKLVLMGSASDFTDISKVFTQFLGLNRRSVEAMNSHFRQLFQMEPDYYSISNFARKLEIKGLLVHDVQDPVCAFTNSERIAANWKDAVLVPVNGAGHSLNSTEALEKIMQFVTG
jgi:pimeloyl-ACP methyl ester carboxylesterase